MIVIALVKIIYKDGETVITAANMNQIQDEIIANQQAIEDLQNQKAPSGYGLGSAELISTDAIDSTKAPGFYCISRAMTVNNVTANYWYMIVGAYGTGVSHSVQKLYPVTTYKVELTRFLQNGTWGEWECINPPMVAGVEYRTTERHKGKAVYAKLVDLGTLPASGEKSYSYSPNAAATLVSLEAYFVAPSGTVNQFPFITSAGVLAGKVSATKHNIYIDAFADLSSNTGFSVIRYTVD